MTENPQAGQEAPAPEPAAAPQKLWFTRLRGDTAVDEVRMICTGGPSLRVVTRLRYKTSGMSGDEWRTSAMIQIGYPGTGLVKEWDDFDGAYSTLDVALQAMYPGVYDHPELHQIQCSAVDFFQKGQRVYHATYGDPEKSPKPMALLAAAGHAPWALIQAGEQGLGTLPLHGRPWTDFCFQTGCPELAVVTFGMHYSYCRHGHRDTAELAGRRFARRFCAKHSLRGDCGLDDADRNYFLLEGEVLPGTSGPTADEISKAVFAGAIDGSALIGDLKPEGQQ